MKKALLLFAAAVMVFAITGCSSVDTATTLHNVKLSQNENDATLAHVHANIWGVYFLGILPVFAGSSARPGSCTVFRDTVRLENAVSMITRKAENLNAGRLVDLQSNVSSNFLILFSINSIQLSGNALK